MISIVISKYNEDTSWIKKYINSYKIFLYIKNENIVENNTHDNLNIEYLPNIGRESHTYLHHIIKNYNNLTDYILFTQGNYTDHVYSLDYLINNKDKNLFDNHPFPNNFRLYYYINDLIPNPDNLNFREWFKKYVVKDYTEYVYNFYFKHGAIFCIKKENILSRPLEYYERLIKLLDTNNSEVGHFFERSWYYIFNLHKKNILLNPDYVIVGSGLSGSVIAERLSTNKNNKILLIEKREHIGGNCYDYIDSDTNILVSKYGAHLFHTNSDKVWEYVNYIDKWIPYTHKVYGKIDDKIFPIPINITTVNILCNKNIKNSDEMIQYLDSVRDKSIVEPKNSEEYCLSVFGKEIYEKIIKDYTKKQWNKFPNELNASVLKRIPIFYDNTHSYFKDKYQALPYKGYTNFINNLVDKNNILVIYNTDYLKYKNNINFKNVQKILYTGPIDSYYSYINLPKLEYRSINFDFEKIYNLKYYQNNSVINYCSNEEKFTRIVEYKHFYNKSKFSDHTIISKEYSTDEGDPYYPVPSDKNIELYNKYKKYADEENNIIFCGRLANYKYFNMDEAILNSLNIYDQLKTFCTYNYDYKDFGIFLENDVIKISFKTKSDAHIGIFDNVNDNIITELVFGAYSNTMNLSRKSKQGEIICEYYCNYCNENEYNFIYLQKINNYIFICDNNFNLLFKIYTLNKKLKIKLSSWDNIFVEWKFLILENSNIEIKELFFEKLNEFLNNSAILCYSTSNYQKLTDLFMKSLINVGFNKDNIIHKYEIIDDNELLKNAFFMSKLFKLCIINKISHIVETLKEKKFKYYICIDCDIRFLKNRKKQFNDLIEFIDNTSNDIYFMRENISNDINGGFYVIKNNKNINDIINFFEFILSNLDVNDVNLPFFEQSLINKYKHRLNYSFIPNKYAIFGEDIYDINNSLFHHFTCCNEVEEKIIQYKKIKDIIFD